MEIAEHIGDRSGHVTALNILAWLSLHEGNVPACLGHTSLALTLTGEAQLIQARIYTLMLRGLAFLNKSDPIQALQYTAQAVELLRARSPIEGAEEAVYLAHYQVLKTLGQIEESELTLGRAQGEIDAKAGHVADPEQRRRYLASWPLDALPRL